jgi:hypothetical protein
VAVVLKDFKCKVTKRTYRFGDVYDGDRVEELQALGYVADEEGRTSEPEKPKRKRKDSEGDPHGRNTDPLAG